MLIGNFLRYYKDVKVEEINILDGWIDLFGCYDIIEVNVGRNYGFRIKVGLVGNLYVFVWCLFLKSMSVLSFLLRFIDWFY